MRAIGYVRVSTEDQAQEGVSLDNQKAKIRAYATLKDLELVEIIEDVGISAKNLNRPGAQRVIALARTKKVQAIIICKLDRMFRSTVDALETARQFDNWGVGLHSISETLDTQSAMGRFFFTLTAALAEMERGIIGERTKTALAYKKSQGRVYGKVAYGFRREGDHLLPNDEEQEAVNLILNLREQGGTYSGIAREMNQLGHRTRCNGQYFPQTIKNIIQLRGV